MTRSLQWNLFKPIPTWDGMRRPRSWLIARANSLPLDDAPFVSMEVESVLAQGDLARARAVLETASGDADANRIISAQTAIYMRDFAKAIQEIDAARKWPMLAGSPIPDLMTGTVASLQGDAGRAKASFEKALEILEPMIRKHPDEPSDTLRTGLGLRWIGPQGRRFAGESKICPIGPKLARRR